MANMRFHGCSESSFMGFFLSNELIFLKASFIWLLYEWHMFYAWFSWVLVCKQMNMYEEEAWLVQLFLQKIAMYETISLRL